MKFTKYMVRIGKNKTKLFARSDHSELRFLDLDLSDATIGGSAGSTLKIKGADGDAGEAGGEVLSEIFDFPFRKGIPIGTINDQGDARRGVAGPRAAFA